MANLLHDIRHGASPKGKCNQKMVQVRQRRDRDSRNADFHPPAGDRVEHPSGHDGDDARRHLDVHDVAASPALNILPPQPPAMQRTPAVVDNDTGPDMGRMTPTLLSVARTGCSLGKTPAATVPPQSHRWSPPPPGSTVSIPKPICDASLSASPIIQ